MTVTTTDLGIAIARALMRDLDGRPVIMETYNPANPLTPHREPTSAGAERIAGQRGRVGRGRADAAEG